MSVNETWHLDWGRYPHDEAIISCGGKVLCRFEPDEENLREQMEVIRAIAEVPRLLECTRLLAHPAVGGLENRGGVKHWIGFWPEDLDPFGKAELALRMPGQDFRNA